MTKLALEIIRIYQRYISPNKGFRCAYGKLHNTYGCSGHIKEMIKVNGLISSIPSIRNQFHQCSEAAKELKEQKDKDEEEEEAESGNDLKETASDCTVTSAECLGEEALYRINPLNGSDCDCGFSDCGISDCGGSDCGSCGDCGSLDCGSGIRAIFKKPLR